MFYSLMTLIRVSTGEGWNFLMDDMGRGPQPNFLCNEIYNVNQYETHGLTACG
jgi:hypothetical protein